MRDNRPQKVKTLLRRLSCVIAKHYANKSPKQKEIIIAKWDKLADACSRYINLEIVWDWKLIDVAEKIIPDRPTRIKTVSTFDCVMEYARDLGHATQN